MCQTREAIRHPAAFAALGSTLCRALDLREPELARLKELGVTLKVTGAFAHGDSESLSIVVFIPRTAESDSREEHYFGEFGMDQAREDEVFPMRRCSLRISSPALICEANCRMVLAVFTYAVGARIQRKYVPVRALVLCSRLAHADSREGTDPHWMRDRQTTPSMTRAWEGMRLWPEEAQHRVGLPVKLEYEPDLCKDALVIALGPCHPCGTCEVPTS